MKHEIRNVVDRLCSIAVDIATSDSESDRAFDAGEDYTVEAAIALTEMIREHLESASTAILVEPESTEPSDHPTGGPDLPCTGREPLPSPIPTSEPSDEH